MTCTAAGPPALPRARSPLCDYSGDCLEARWGHTYCTGVHTGVYTGVHTGVYIGVLYLLEQQQVHVVLKSSRPVVIWVRDGRKVKAEDITKHKASFTSCLTEERFVLHSFGVGFLGAFVVWRVTGVWME